MKRRWHFLFLVIAFTAGCCFAWWLTQPVWVIAGYEQLRYAGRDKSRFELTSLTSSNDRKDWFMEVHDWRTGQLLRKNQLEVTGPEGDMHYLSVSETGDTTNAPMLFTEHHYKKRITCYLLDPVTGKRLSPDTISGWCLNGLQAWHGTQLALALKSEVRLFRDKTDPGRSVPLPSVRKVSFFS